MGSPRTSAFAAARLPVGPALASGGFPGADVLRFYRADRFFRERKLPFSLGRFVRSHILICPVILVSSGLPGKAGILPGVTLLPFATVLADFHGGKSTILSCTRWSPTLLDHLGSDEVRFAQIADVPFSRLSATPFLTSLLAARVSFRRWLSLPQGREPFASASSHLLADPVSSLALHCTGLPIGGA